MNKKKKTYVLLVSRRFIEKIKSGEKIHTIRDNYEWWYKRFQVILAGDGILSIRYWTETPYRSPQDMIIDLSRDDGIGIERIERPQNLCMKRQDDLYPVDWTVEGRLVNSPILAKNDGLLLDEFIDWFNPYPAQKPMALIHFNDMRYAI